MNTYHMTDPEQTLDVVSALRESQDGIAVVDSQNSVVGVMLTETHYQLLQSVLQLVRNPNELELLTAMHVKFQNNNYHETLSFQDIFEKKTESAMAAM